MNVAELIDTVDALLEEAANYKADLGAVNWGDLKVIDVEYRKSMLHGDDGGCYYVIIDEASPTCGLTPWLYQRIDREKFPNVFFECEW